MRRQHRNIKQGISFLLLSFFILSCSQGKNLEGKASKSAQKQTSDTRVLTPDDLEDADTGSASTTSKSTTTTTSKDSAACIATRKKMQDLYDYCRGLINYYSSSLGSCPAALSKLTSTTNCSTLDASLASFKSTCNSGLSQYQSIISSEAPNCYKAIQASK